MSEAATTLPGLPAASAGRPPVDQGHPRKWWILVVVSLGMFMALLDVTIVNIATPAIIEGLHTTVAGVSWVLNSYSLVLAMAFLSMGRVADRYGQRRVFLFGLVAFTVFSMLCGFAPSVGWLVAFRAGQGLGGAALMTVSLAIVLSAFPQRQQGTAVGIWGALGQAAAAIGPSLGGVLIAYGDWSWIFFVNIPIGLVAVAVCAWIVPRDRPHSAEGGLDIPGILISGAGLFCLTLALVQADAWGWRSPVIVALGASAAATFPVFMWWETRTPSPMFPVGLLRIRPFMAANTAIMFLGVAMGGTFLMLVIFLVTVSGYSELRAALAISVMPVLALLVAPNAGRLTDRIGPRLPSALGAACFGVGLLLMARLDGDSGLHDVMWRVAFLGVGMGLATPTLSAASVAALPPRVRGVGSGSLNTMRQVGFTIGVALVVAIFSHAVAQNARRATREATALIAASRQLGPAAKSAYTATLLHNAKAAAGAGVGTPMTTDPLAGAPPTTEASQGAFRELDAALAKLYHDRVADSFTWPFYAAACGGLLAVVPALLTGRRLGEQGGGRAPEPGRRADSP